LQIEDYLYNVLNLTPGDIDSITVSCGSILVNIVTNNVGAQQTIANGGPITGKHQPILQYSKSKIHCALLDTIYLHRCSSCFSMVVMVVEEEGLVLIVVVGGGGGGGDCGGCWWLW
jgi:hypothetical protein